MAGSVYKIAEGNKEIVVVEYSGCKEAEMIVTAAEAKRVIVEGGKKIFLLSIYGPGSRATPGFMDYLRKETTDVLPFLDKQAVVGLDPVKKLILKGYNFLVKRNIRAFDTREEAITFLLNEHTTDRDVPDYLK